MMNGKLNHRFLLTIQIIYLLDNIKINIAEIVYTEIRLLHQY